MEIWDGVYNGVTSLWSGIVGFFTGIVTGVQNAFNGVSDVIINAFNGAVTFLQELPAKALEWAGDMMQGFVDGIENGISAVGDAIKGVADKITSFLHFSRPDEGPLRQYETWMPDMMMGLASGITNNVGLVKEALSGMTGTMSAKVTGEVSRPDECPLREYETWMPDMMQGLAAGITGNVGLVKEALSGMTGSMSAKVTGEVSGSTATSTSGGGGFNFAPQITVNVGSGGTVKESLPSIEEQLNIFMTDYVEKMRLRNPQIFAY